MKIYTFGCSVCGELHCYDNFERADEELEKWRRDEEWDGKHEHRDRTIVAVDSEKVPMFL